MTRCVNPATRTLIPCCTSTRPVTVPQTEPLDTNKDPLFRDAVGTAGFPCALTAHSREFVVLLMEFISNSDQRDASMYELRQIVLSADEVRGTSEPITVFHELSELFATDSGFAAESRPHEALGARADLPSFRLCFLPQFPANSQTRNNDTAPSVADSEPN